MFNLKKQAEADPTVSYDKQLKKHREESGTGIPDEGITELQFKHNQHKDKDNTVHFESQLEESRISSPESIVEHSLNTKPTVFNLKRDDRTHDKPIKSQDLVAAAYDQEHREALAEANKGQDRDTEFWDKEVGIQMIGKPTKIIRQDQKSQLQNTPDKFKNLKPDLLQKIDESVVAKLSQADKMLFHIYATATKYNRELTASEEQQIKDINSGKTRLLIAAQKTFKKAQWGDSDDFGDDFGAMENNMIDGGSDLENFETNEVFEDIRHERDSEVLDNLIMDQDSRTGKIIVVDNGEIIDEFESFEEAKANYPEAEITNINTDEDEGPVRTLNNNDDYDGWSKDSDFSTDPRDLE